MDTLFPRQRWNIHLVILSLISVSHISATLLSNISGTVTTYKNPYSNSMVNFDTITTTHSLLVNKGTNKSVVTSSTNNATLLSTKTSTTTVQSAVNTVAVQLQHKCTHDDLLACAQLQMISYLEDAAKQDNLVIMEGVEVHRIKGNSVKENEVTDVDEYFINKLKQYYNTHVLHVELHKLNPNPKSSARAWIPSIFKPEVAGKSSFLTGFGLGFLAFGLKKLLLPLFIGGQIIKSVLIAMFLPSILGGLGKLVGKGVTTFASASGSSGSGGTNTVDDFDFKDNGAQDDSSASESSYSGTYAYPDTSYSGSYQQNSISRTPAFMVGALPASSLYASPAASSSTASRYQVPAAAPKVSYVGASHHYSSSSNNYNNYNSYYNPNKQQHDYKVFHDIPSSSLLLTNYDPFYSPLLSRLDSVFSQLSYDSEACRERLVCAMYRNPAKFAPYSNLVSAQLSRELNELRKPSSDNPDILRFFRYMKAAKDGQDNKDCIAHYPGCVVSKSATSNPPMLKTYNDINKLVQARRLGRHLSTLSPADNDSVRTSFADPDKDMKNAGVRESTTTSLEGSARSTVVTARSEEERRGGMDEEEHGHPPTVAAAPDDSRNVTEEKHTPSNALEEEIQSTTEMQKTSSKQ